MARLTNWRKLRTLTKLNKDIETKLSVLLEGDVRRFVSLPLTFEISKFSIKVLKKDVRDVSNTSIRYQEC